MNNDSPRLRLSILGLVVLSLFAALFTRLWFLQVMEADEYQVTVEGNSIREVPEEAPRGRILDRNGKIIVDNVAARVVTVNPHDLDEQDDRDDLVLRLASELTAAGVPTKVADIEDRLADPQFSRFEPVPVAVDVPEELEVYLAERADEFPSVAVQRRWIRSYPNGRLAAHVVGYVGRINEEELKDKQGGPDNPEKIVKEYEIGSEIGKAGIEQVYEDQLRGTPGLRTIEVDAENRPVRTVEYLPPVRGNDIQLAMDVDIQTDAEEALREQLEFVRGRTNRDGGVTKAPAGSVVVLDPTNGDVLAMASYPDYDPNEFVGGISVRRYRDLVGDSEADNPLINRAIQGQYAPGSTFKLVTSYAAMNSKLIDAGYVYTDGGSYTIEGCGGDSCTRRNAKGTPHGTIGLSAALTVSSDTFFYRLGDLFWIDREVHGDAPIQEAARQLGFDAPTGIDLPSERAGYIDDPARRKERYEDDPAHAGWSSGDNVNLAIGQGVVTVTPLQLANSYAALAEHGTRYTPRVVLRVLAPVVEDPMVMGPVVLENDVTVAAEVPFPDEVWGPIHAGLAGVASSSSPQGTAYTVFQGFDQSNFPLVSKTGTAQVGTRSNKKTDTSLFVTYGPDPDARYVVAAVLEETGFGADGAVPVSRRILEPITGQPQSTPEEIAALGVVPD